MDAQISNQIVLSLIDLTSLKDTDDESTIATLCNSAVTPQGHVSAVCVYPRFVKQAATCLINQKIKIATVVNFPHGNDDIKIVVQTIHEAIKHGAHEIDAVIPYQQYLTGDKQRVSDFVRSCKQACGQRILLKVIIESGSLQYLGIIRDVSRVVLLAGADFIKTSTGKIAIGATLDAARVMLSVIKEMSVKLNRPLGFKAAGGIRTREQMLSYIDLAREMMGDDWVTAEHFRIGASQLVV